LFDFENKIFELYITKVFAQFTEQYIVLLLPFWFKTFERNSSCKTQLQTILIKTTNIASPKVVHETSKLKPIRE